MLKRRSICVVHIGLASALGAVGGLGCGGSVPDSAATGANPRAHVHRAVPSPEGGTSRHVYHRRMRAYISAHHGQPMQWKLARPPHRDEVWIAQRAGFCGSPLSEDPADFPQVKGVRQEVSSKKIVLTFFVIAAPFPKSDSCAGLGTMLYAAVRVRGGLRGRPLYDGSQSPPVKRWPRAAHD